MRFFCLWLCNDDSMVLGRKRNLEVINWVRVRRIGNEKCIIFGRLLGLNLIRCGLIFSFYYDSYFYGKGNRIGFSFMGKCS